MKQSMKIIALVGKSDTGKTTTLNNVYIDLLSQGYVTRFYNQVGAFKEDFKAILVKDGVKIGIATVGDFAIGKKVNQLESKRGCRTAIEYIEEFAQEDCHKVICAISLGVNKEENIREVLPPFNYIVSKSETPNEFLFDSINREDKKTILTLLDS